ncbi:hypothetical protein AVEN_47647-1 [Araneus ventricosus]|uniref:Uncharacterized protein n=1 Tax=Araneus ventricosus TaxID=182803 RepID=A0A4Y2T8C8_ARAVE|nr:hypothetical protein AVEN_47647-1 [Araneus ventricosus]
MLDSGPEGPTFKSTHYHSGDPKNTQHPLSVPLLDGSTKHPINSIYYYVQQMAALQLLHQALPHSKSMTHFIAQILHLHMPALKQTGQQSAHMRAEHRFLGIQIISNKLGVAPVVTVTPSYSVMYMSQYQPPDKGNSFCLVVKMLDSGPKGPRFKSTHCHSGYQFYFVTGPIVAIDKICFLCHAHYRFDMVPQLTGHQDLQTSLHWIFFWGYVKDKVYSREIRDVEDLRASITLAIATVTTGMLQRTWLELDYRLDILRATKAAHVD